LKVKKTMLPPLHLLQIGVSNSRKRPLTATENEVEALDFVVKDEEGKIAYVERLGSIRSSSSLIATMCDIMVHLARFRSRKKKFGKNAVLALRV
jgi:hypothetical protein